VCRKTSCDGKREMSDSIGAGNVMSILTTKSCSVICFMVVLLFCTACSNAQGWQQVWADEFNETTIDNSTWSFDSGPANDNIHYFTDRPENARIEDGKLYIIALEEPHQGYSYTSALLKTSRSVYWRYGRIEARIKLPASNGLVPAFWMLPEDDLYGWWPWSGEIDIMEHPTNQVNRIYGTVQVLHGAPPKMPKLYPDRAHINLLLTGAFSEGILSPKLSLTVNLTLLTFQLPYRPTI